MKASSNESSSSSSAKTGALNNKQIAIHTLAHVIVCFISFTPWWPMADVLTYVRLGWTLTTSKINRLRNYVDVSHTDEIDGSRPDGLFL